MSGQLPLTAGQRRAAALVRLACGGDSPMDARSIGGSIGVSIDVVVDLATLLHLQDGPAELMGPGIPGSVPVTAEAIRHVLDDPSIGITLRRLVSDPLTGTLIDRGRSTYEAPDALRAFLSLRDRTCRFPGCARSAVACQMDHAIPWDAGGQTDLDNLGALCVRHHQLKTLGGWTIRDSRRDGRCTWISPSGRRYVHEPPPVLGEPQRPPTPLPETAPAQHDDVGQAACHDVGQAACHDVGQAARDDVGQSISGSTRRV
jgi:hypothetical protein